MSSFRLIYRSSIFLPFDCVYHFVGPGILRKLAFKNTWHKHKTNTKSQYPMTTLAKRFHELSTLFLNRHFKVFDKDQTYVQSTGLCLNL